MNTAKKTFDWLNIIFFLVLTLFAIIGTSWLCIAGTMHLFTWLLAAGYMIATGLAVTAGYHRLFAHKSYKVIWPVRLIFLLFGAAAFEGSALEWATDHRNHHRYTDTDKDPYGINKGFWHAHMGWLFLSQHRNYENVADLNKDLLIRWQHKYYFAIAVIMGFVLPAIIAALWGDLLGGIIIAGALRMTLNHQFTFAINSVCHYFGKRPYSKRQSARDNWLTAFFTFGEGFHNFHHQFPLDYRNGVKAYHFDPTKWLIKFLSWFGMAHNLNRISEHRIIRYRLQAQEDVVMQKIASMPDRFRQMIEPVRDRIHQLLNYLDDLEKEYLQMYKEKYKSKKEGQQEQQQLLSYQSRFQMAKRELRENLASWGYLLQRV